MPRCSSGTCPWTCTRTSSSLSWRPSGCSGRWDILIFAPCTFLAPYDCTFLPARSAWRWTLPPGSAVASVSSSTPTRTRPGLAWRLWRTTRSRPTTGSRWSILHLVPDLLPLLLLLLSMLHVLLVSWPSWRHLVFHLPSPAPAPSEKVYRDLV